VCYAGPVTAHVATLVKPRLRGVSHQFAFFVFVGASLLLSWIARGGSAKLSIAIYGASLAFLYGVSSLYHRRTWGPAARQRMRSLDHSAIFVLIAGSYTPLFLLLPRGAPDPEPLLFVWSVAAIGVAKSLVFPNAPKWITAAMAVFAGWAVVMHVVRLVDVMGWPSLSLLCASGVVYTAGAVVYARRRPDPIPLVFGYHEVFHVFVIAGSALHFGHVLLVLTAAGAL
jgi:hemolysin III